MSSMTKFNFVADLLSRQNDMLKGKDKCLYELYDFCDNDNQRVLIKQLLIDFHEMDDNIYNLCLLEMRKELTGKRYPLNECMVAAMAHDHMPDGSQAVLNDIKTYLCMDGWPSTNFCNRADHCSRFYKNGIRHFFIIDDFVGSGTTVLLRKKTIEQQLNGNIFTLHFVVAAGMKEAIRDLKAQGIDITCIYTMDKCISGKGTPMEINDNLIMMASLESKLADVINCTNLVDFHLGYKQTEALFCRKHKNIPNNVLPIFGWKEDKQNKKRNTLFIRVQKGY